MPAPADQPGPAVISVSQLRYGAEPVAVQILNQSTKLQVTKTATKNPGSDFQDIIFTVTSVIVNIDGKLLEELCEDTRYHANNTVEGMF